MQPHFNFQGNEIFAVLTFLGTTLALLLCAGTLIAALLSRRKKIARRALWIAVALVLTYGAVLLGFSLRSHEQVLAQGQEKYFCEVDCHLAYAVIEVRKAPVLGLPPQQASARGVFYVVRVRVRFDAGTISSRRGNFPLQPNPRQVTALDGAGRRFESSLAGQKVLAAGLDKVPSFADPLRPGDSFVVDLVFDLPVDGAEPRLLIVEDDWRTRLLIGHENRFLHKKTGFRLQHAVTGGR